MTALEAVKSGLSSAWRNTSGVVRDCVPQRVLEDTVPIVSDEDGEAVLATKKSRKALARLSGAVCGIEFCYAAETAFVSPVLLRIGIQERFMTMIWCLSPLIGFFTMPVLGSASDRCPSKLGRRRPFILLLSAGIVVGLVLVPYGYKLGAFICGTPESPEYDYLDTDSSPLSSSEPMSNYSSYNVTYSPPYHENISMSMIYHPSPTSAHVCSTVFTIIGVVLLDFNCDACQSPARAYLIDVTEPSDHARGLATFSFMAGLGGAVGYMIGGIPWKPPEPNDPVSGQVRIVFGIVLGIFIIAVSMTITAEREKTLFELNPNEKRKKKKYTQMQEERENMEMGILEQQKTYGSQSQSQREDIVPPHINQVDNGDTSHTNHTANHITGMPNGTTQRTPRYQTVSESSDLSSLATKDSDDEYEVTEPIIQDITMMTYILSIVFMPRSLKILCVTHLLGWMSLLCYSLYFTDFVGRSVYGGDPYARPGSVERKLYAEGVRMGSIAMAMYSVTCSICSFMVDKIIIRFGKLLLFL